MNQLALGGAPPMLLSDRGCPFAHRVLALFDHLGVAFDERCSAVGDKPDGIENYSPSGRIPLLVHGGLVITESRVMLDHLAEYYAFDDAYPEDLAARTLHRHAMTLVDNVLAPLLMHEDPAVLPRLDEAIAALESATATISPCPCLLALHVAPLWLRFRWWRPDGAVTRRIERQSALVSWLDGAASLACVLGTAPERKAHLEDVARARRAGLMT